MSLTEAQVLELYRNTGKEPPAEFGGKKPAKKAKYNNQKTTFEGITFDSASEAEAYYILKAWEACGAITGLRMQPTFTLQEKFRDTDGKTIKAIKYSADFQFYDVEAGRARYVDVKGKETEAFRRVMKQMRSAYPLIHIEVWDRKKVKELSRV